MILWWTVRQLRSHNWPKRLRAAKTLARSRHPQAVQLLIPLLKDEQFYVREAAALGLGALGNTHAAEPLLSSLMDIDRRVREAADKALTQIAGDWKKSELGRNAVPSFIAALGSRDLLVKYHAASTLGAIGDPRAVEPLVQALKQKNSAAAYALGRIGDVRGVQPLLDAIKERDPNVRDAAQKALASLASGPNGRQATYAFVAALQDSDWNVRTTAEKALASVDTHWPQSEAVRTAIPAFLAALKNASSGVRSTAAKVLGLAGDQRALGPLLQALLDDSAHHAAEEALSKLDPTWMRSREAKSIIPAAIMALT